MQITCKKWNGGESGGKDVWVGDGAAVDGYAEWLVGWVGRRVQMVGVWGGDRAEKLDEWVGNFAASTRSGSQGAPP